MMWPFNRREHRESYTDQRVADAEARAAGVTPSSLSAVVEAALGLWERGMSSADCERMSPAQLAVMGRQLLGRGECVYLRERGKIGAVASTIDIKGGGANPNTWTYRMDLPGPNTTRTVTRSGSDVLHVRIGATVQRPWVGCSPLANAAGTRALLSAVEQSLTYEAGGPVGNILPVPSLERAGNLADDLKKLKGNVALAETTAAAHDVNARPRGDYDKKRFGPDWPASEIEARRDVERSVAAACGIPAILLGLGSAGSGEDSREAWRQFVFSTLVPVARLLEAELDRIGLPAPVSFERLAASDLSGRARAYGSLVTGGMDPKRAAEIAGF